ncbi:hypothetical protein A3Q56_08525 [Intoshia linei]|uniref:Uncharacterized protein n=1 Tax=Intoshia linei TaxID=1819745 RepID=A0A177ANZ5_9BILA|nr:hypothetical protein A3Q56_08525 [Intoshia linei]
MCFNYATSLFYIDCTIDKRNFKCLIDTGAVSSFLPSVFKANKPSYKKFTDVNGLDFFVNHNIDMFQNPTRLRNSLSSQSINFIKDKLTISFDPCDPQLNSNIDLNMAYLSKSFEETIKQFLLYGIEKGVGQVKRINRTIKDKILTDICNMPTSKNKQSPAELLYGRSLSVPFIPRSILINNTRNRFINSAKSNQPKYQ